MSGSLVLLLLTPAAPVPKPLPPPIEVTAKRYAHPPRQIVVNGVQQQLTVDDGNYIEVTIRNTSSEAISVKTRHELGDLVYVKSTNEKGVEVTKAGFHLLVVCSSIARPVELKSGESATVIAHLLQDWPQTDVNTKPGKYTVRVVFAFEKIKAESAEKFDLEMVK